SLNLAKCLEALEAQTLDRSRFEIIVIDNESSDNVEQVVSKYDSRELLHELQPGSYCARNKGILESKGDILALTDSDCIPDKNWLNCGFLSFADKADAGFIAGRLTFFPQDENNLNAAELWEMFHNYHSEDCVKVMHFGLTANLFVRRGVFNKVGLFNQDLKSAGDYEWGNRVYDQGLGIYYDENAVVKHPARRTLSSLINKTRRLIGGQLEAGLVSKSYCLKKIMIDVFPPVLTVFRLLKRDDIKSLGRADYKIKFLFVFVVLRYVGVYEMARLLLRGKSIR
ncbi:MAG: glycosyltransferase, partial [Candidatus Dadabacteria bacterium]|nr:glycosyltransferase [Candidatus Dadabacteria bacterium]